MKPIVKYRGGKSREIPQFKKYIPHNYQTYIEPFFGGGALYFHLSPENAIINDYNSKLMDFYQCVKDNYDVMRLQLDELQQVYEANQLKYKELKAVNPEVRVENQNEALYYSIRDMFNNKTESDYLYGVLYYFINKTAYSGMVRYNKMGEFNVPFGRYVNFNTKLLTEEHSELLNRSHLYNDDYSKIFEMATSNDFIFLDPPYDCVFNDYGNLSMEDGFNIEHHKRLANDFKNLSSKTMMIIGKTDLTMDLYSSFVVDEYPLKYSVNIRNRFDTEAKHLVILNYKK